MEKVVQAVFKSVRSEVFALAKHGDALSHIEVSRNEFEALIASIEQLTGVRHKRDALEFLADGVLVRVTGADVG